MSQENSRRESCMLLSKGPADVGNASRWTHGRGARVSLPGKRESRGGLAALPARASPAAASWVCARICAVEDLRRTRSRTDQGQRRDRRLDEPVCTCSRSHTGRLGVSSLVMGRHGSTRPCLVNLQPSGEVPMRRFYYACCLPRAFRESRTCLTRSDHGDGKR